MKALEDNEILAIQIENKRMRDELAGVIVGNRQDQKSELSLFKEFLETQKAFRGAEESREDRLRARIIEEMGEHSDVEPDSPQDIFFKAVAQKLSEGVDISKTPEKVAENQPQGEIQPVIKTDEQILAETPEYVKEHIKKGNLDLEDVKQAASEQKGTPITKEEEEQIDRLFKKVKGGEK